MVDAMEALEAMEALAAAQHAMLSAERCRARAATRHRQAVTALRAAQRARIAALRLATAGGTPEVMKRAAEVTGTSTSRVYQLLREYDRRDPNHQRSDEHHDTTSPRRSGPRRRQGS